MEEAGGRLHAPAAGAHRGCPYAPRPAPPAPLRRALIPMHPDLKYAGVLPPLDAPHHLRSTE